MPIEAFGLESTARTDRRPCGPSSQSRPSHRMPSRIPSTISGRRSLDVGVLDAQDEHAAVASGKQPVEERGASAADVEVAGGRRSEANARDHGNWMGCRQSLASGESACRPELAQTRASEVGLPAEARSSSRRAKVGEAGIRTLGTAFRPYNGLANRRLQPLGHLTALNYRRFQRAATGFLLMAASPINACPTIAQRREAPSIDQWNAPSRIIGSAN